MTKELQKFEKTQLYKSMMRYFDKLPKEEYVILEKGEHLVEVKQNEFNGYMRLMKGYVELQTHVEYLKSLSKKSE